MTRPTRRTKSLLLAAVGLLVVVTGLGLSGGGPASAQEQEQGQGDEPGRVLIVSLPTLRWEDVVEQQPPAILDVVGRSAVASTSLRTIGPHTDAGEAYATIGSGNRASVPVDVAGLAYEPSFPLEWGTAGEVYERRTDLPVAGSSVVHLGIAWVQRANDSLRYETEPGVLATTLGEHDLSTAVVANADLLGVPHREAALAMMDGDGRVDGGAVSADLLSPDPNAAFGTQLDLRATASAAERALEQNDVVLVEASDLARVDGYWSWMTQEAAVEARRRAITAADQLVAELMAGLDLERDTLMLIGPTSPSSTSSAQLTVFTLAGPGIEPGLARSGTTRRSGYITLPDVAPTVLDHFDIEQPDAMNGTPITSSGGGAPDRGDLETMVDVNEVAVFRDKAVGPVSVAYIVIQVAFYALAIFAMVRGETSRWRTLVLGGTLWVLAIPPLVFLSALVRYDALTVAGYVALLVVAAAGLAALSWWAFRRHLLGPPLALTGFTLVLLLADVMAGGRLQINTVFGYSPTVAGRFAGFGNLAFALVGICAVTVATALWATARLAAAGVTGDAVEQAADEVAGASDSGEPVVTSNGEPAAAGSANGEPGAVRAGGGVVSAGGEPEPGTGRRGDEAALPAESAAARSGRSRVDWWWWVVAAILAGTSIVIGYPSWGSDVGGVLASMPAFGIVLLLLAGARLQWRRLVVLGVATVVVLGAFAALDLSRPEEKRTHLGRFVESIGSGGAMTIVTRKLGANIDILTSTVWAWLVPAGLVFLVLLLRRDRGMLGTLQRKVPGFRAFLIGALTVGGLGMAVNDSGVAVPAMMFGVALPYLTYVVIRTEKGTALPVVVAATAPNGPAPDPADGDHETASPVNPAAEPASRGAT